MVYYNTKEWLKPLLQFHKADTFRKLLPILFIIGLFTAGIAYIELYYLQLGADSWIKNVTLMHSLLGFAISMLLVFRTNSAYDRWWEGRKLWGSLVNSSRNLAVKIDSLLPANDFANRNYFRKLIGLFPMELHLHLRKETTRTALDETADSAEHAFDFSRHMPVQVSQAIHKKMYGLKRAGIISETEALLINQEMQTMLDVCGACERIQNTPIPYSYSAFIKKFIAVYVLTLPFGFVFSLGWFAIPVVMFIFYVLASLELIAEEIEDPFGGDTNDLPTQKLAENIRKAVYEIISLPAAEDKD